MIANLESSGGLIYSQRVLLALVDAGMDRQEAYKLIQRHAHGSWHGAVSFQRRDRCRSCRCGAIDSPSTSTSCSIPGSSCTTWTNRSNAWA